MIGIPSGKDMRRTTRSYPWKEMGCMNASNGSRISMRGKSGAEGLASSGLMKGLTSNGTERV